MDEEVKLKVFEPFFSTKGFGLGRGLGMSGVYSIVKKCRGNIFVKSSEISKGTTFELDFPVVQDIDAIDAIAEIVVNLKKERKPFDVLWVDDDVVITESISELLGLMGHKYVISNSGAEALEHLDKSTFDVVFTDIGMPDMNGWELIDKIKKKFGKKIKIVVVSGWGVDEESVNQHVIDFVLQKPFTLDKLESLFMEI